MRFWLPVLALEIVILWFFGRERNTGSDDAQGNAVMFIFFAILFCVGDAITLIYRNW